MITTHYLLLCALFDARPSGHAIKNGGINAPNRTRIANFAY